MEDLGQQEAKKMLGRTLVTHQTGPAGKQVNRIYIEDGSGIETEMYLALLVDRATSRVSFVCSTEGGMDIEEVAAETPEKILSFTVDPATGYQPYHGRRVAFALGLKGAQVKQCVALMGMLFKAFMENLVQLRIPNLGILIMKQGGMVGSLPHLHNHGEDKSLTNTKVVI